jgi:hypothetical protein
MICLNAFIATCFCKLYYIVQLFVYLFIVTVFAWKDIVCYVDSEFYH